MNITGNSFDNNEGFRMRGRRSSSATGAAAGGAAGAGIGALAAGGTAATMSSSGNVAQCPLNDDSFYCQLSRGANIASMILFIIVVVSSLFSFFYFAYIFMFGMKKGRK